MKQRTKNLWFWLGGGLLCLACGLFWSLMQPISVTAQVDPQAESRPAVPLTAGPDLAIQSLVLDPAHPAPGQIYTATVVIKNVGDSALSTGFYIHFYVDPPQQPPTPTTPHTSRVGWFLGLNAGATFTWHITDLTFATPGCNHISYVWVDRDNTSVESNENNNLTSLPVCVGSEGRDTYEPDDTCEQAKPLGTDGITQAHTLSPLEDEDWYQFTGIGGVEYIITVADVGANAQSSLSLFSRCDQPGSFSGGQRLLIKLVTSGVYYVRVVNDATSGPDQTAYTIAITSPFDCAGFYEANDSQATAKEITTDGVTQQQRFCKPGDEDWVKFSVQAGITYTMHATGVGAAAAPLLTGYADAATAHSENPLQLAATNDGIFYVRVVNTTADAYGPTTDYTLAVSAQACAGDPFEPDNDRADARLVPVNAGVQAYLACPAGDRDWSKFTATAGVTYTLETVDVGAASDTVMCLYDNIGAQIACNDDSGFKEGARLTWQATAPGDYFVEVHQANAQAAGAETAYEFGIVTGACKTDIYEPDNAVNQVGILSADGTRQFRNFCPDDDRDWIKFQVPAAGIYTLRTAVLSPNSDTYLNLYAADRTTLLTSNDDYGPGLASEIVYNFGQPGTYYLEVRHFNPARYGRNTSYTLSASAGRPTPTPTPTPPGNGGPPRTPTPTPPPSGIQTLILVNRERFNTHYGATQTDSLFTKLALFANHAAVQGEVVEVDRNTTVAATYAAWVDDEINVEKANAVTSAIRSLALDYLVAHTSVQYMMVIGDDRIIPARRIKDRSHFPESEYPALGAQNAVGAALAGNYFLTDDYFADREPILWEGAELYIPDWAIGRLVETPAQIEGMIDAFMNASELTLGKTLVVGYDFVQDAAANICELAGRDLGAANLNCTLIGDRWNGNQFRDLQLHANPPFRFQSINTHASHASQGVPVGSTVTAHDILSATANLSGAVIFSIGCHSGLSAPANTSSPLDLPEAFARQRVNYVGNTGFGWGSSIGVYLSERVMQNFTEELLKGTTMSVGKALTIAKQRYHQETTEFEGLDEKVLQQPVLYGFPMVRVFSGGTLGDRDPFPSVTITSPLGNSVQQGQIVQATTQQAGVGHVSIQVNNTRAVQASAPHVGDGFVQQATAWGSYYQLDGHIHALAEGPIQPQVFADLTPPVNQQLHGVVFTGGAYYTTTLDPVMVAPMNEYTPVTTEPEFQTEDFFPLVPFSLQGRSHISHTGATLTVALGQYDSASGVQRLYDNVEYDVYFSAAEDQVGPTITAVDGYYNTRTSQASFKVEAGDIYTVTRVLIAYTTNTGEWTSFDLNYNATTHKWSGHLPGARDAAYFVQAVDSAGNVTTILRKGGYFRLDEVDLLVAQNQITIYLPVIVR